MKLIKYYKRGEIKKVDLYNSNGELLQYWYDEEYESTDASSVCEFIELLQKHGNITIPIEIVEDRLIYPQD